MNKLTGKDAAGGVTKYELVRGFETLNSVNKTGLKKLYDNIYDRLAAYERTGLDPEGIIELNTFAGSQLERMLEKLQDMTAERDELQKAFALACRILGDNYDYDWKTWQGEITGRVATERVCRVCGCTYENACPGGCSWVEEDLCSACAEEAENEDSDAELPPGVVLPVDPETGDNIYDETDQELFDGGGPGEEL